MKFKILGIFRLNDLGVLTGSKLRDLCPPHHKLWTKVYWGKKKRIREGWKRRKEREIPLAIQSGRPSLAGAWSRSLLQFLPSFFNEDITEKQQKN